MDYDDIRERVIAQARDALSDRRVLYAIVQDNDFTEFEAFLARDEDPAPIIE